MVKKADTVAKRWDELVNTGPGIELAARLKEFEEKARADVVEEKIDANVLATLPDLVDPTIVSWILDPKSFVDQAVQTAFVKTGLDPKNPIHWTILVYLFAFVHFGKWPGRGRRREWTRQKYAQLHNDFQSIRNQKPTISSVEVCRILKKRHGDRYRSSAERLDKEVKKAYNPQFNTALARFVDMMLSIEKAVRLKQGLTWSPDDEAEARNRTVKLLQERRGRQKAISSAPTTSIAN
jgi:hypothetical protein